MVSGLLSLFTIDTFVALVEPLAEGDPTVGRLGLVASGVAPLGGNIHSVYDRVKALDRGGGLADHVASLPS